MGSILKNILLCQLYNNHQDGQVLFQRLMGWLHNSQCRAWYGVTGILAHNYLSGKYFFDLEVGDELQLVYGNA